MVETWCNSTIAAAKLQFPQEQPASRLRGLARQTGRAAFDADDVAQLAVLHLIQRLGAPLAG
jgi:DNA-directed RNA polymerase specialized sigma24 family protein